MLTAENYPFICNGATSMLGKAGGVAANFSVKFVELFSATPRSLLGMGFRETLRRGGKFSGGVSVSFGESTEKAVMGKHSLRLLCVFIKNYNINI